MLIVFLYIRFVELIWDQLILYEILQVRITNKITIKRIDYFKEIIRKNFCRSESGRSLFIFPLWIPGISRQRPFTNVIQHRSRALGPEWQSGHLKHKNARGREAGIKNNCRFQRSAALFFSPGIISPVRKRPDFQLGAFKNWPFLFVFCLNMFSSVHKYSWAAGKLKFFTLRRDASIYFLSEDK